MKLLWIALMLGLAAGCAATADEHQPGPGEACLKCQTPLGADDEAYACSYACTFCPSCTQGMQHVCPNCQGKLEPRPRGQGPLR